MIIYNNMHHMSMVNVKVRQGGGDETNIPGGF